MRHKSFLGALLAGNRKEASRIVHDEVFQNGTGVQELYETIIKNALYDIGEMWERGEISVATEHLASAIVEAILNELYQKIITSDISNDYTVVVSCVENEHHQVGSKMVADVFEMNGWNTYFLGANTPRSELKRFIGNMQPQWLALSVSIYFHIPDLEEMIEEIRQSFPGLKILAGGQAFLHGGTEVLEKYENVKYLPDLTSLDSYLKNEIASV
ncbi:MAG: cobalamin B12-binding domain-containing protein [Bacteroidota bacterium]